MSIPFDADWYRSRYPDVATSGVDPLNHYLLHGRFEQRLPCAPDDYLANVLEAAVLPRAVLPATPVADHSRTIVTCVFNGIAERQVMEPIATTAAVRGYSVNLTSDSATEAEVGLYCSHRPIPRARLSVVMLHDLGQEQWPDAVTPSINLWSAEPWSAFDIGVLPGPSWAEAWRQLADLQGARPRRGVFELGWPKADRAFADTPAFAAEVAALRLDLGLAIRPSVLLALSWESAEKVAQFVAALRPLNVNLLLKFDPEHLGVIGNVERGNGVHVIDPKTNILHCLALSDVLVSDESSCLAEALLFEVPGLAVTDWLVPALPRHGLPARAVEPPSFATPILAAQLRQAVALALASRVTERGAIQERRSQWFSHIGRSSHLLIDLIEAASTGAAWPFQPVDGL